MSMSSITVNAPYLHHNVARAFVFHEIRQGHLSLALTLTYVRRLFLATAPRLLTRVPNLATPQKSIIRPRIK